MGGLGTNGLMNSEMHERMDGLGTNRLRNSEMHVHFVYIICCFFLVCGRQGRKKAKCQRKKKNKRYNIK